MASITPHTSSADHDDHTHPQTFQPYAPDGYYHHEHLHQPFNYHPEPTTQFDPSLVAETYYQHPPNDLWSAPDPSQAHYPHPPVVNQPRLPLIADHLSTHVHSASDYMSNSTETEAGSDGDGDNEPPNDQRANRKRAARATGSSASKKVRHGAAENVPADDTSDKPKARRRANACTHCQRLKMRCVGADNRVPCDRCRNQGQECVFEKGNRGGNAERKRQRLLDQIRRMEKTVDMLDQPGFIPITDNTASRPPTFLSPLSEVHTSFGYPSANALGLTIIDGSPVYVQQESELFPSHSRTPFESPAVQGGSLANFDTQTHQDNRLPTRSRDTSPNNVQRGKNTRVNHRFIVTPSDINAVVSQLGAGSFNTVEDQVRPEILNVVSNEEVAELFDIYFNHMNTHCGLLERGFHTRSMVSSKSPFLLTAICAIASKFYDTKPELYSELSKIAQNLAFSTLERGYKSVEIIQAYLLLTLWPLQGRTWMMLGLAIRIATDMNLHRESTGQPSSALVKERRNRERTWLVCYVLDRSLGIQNGKPYSITEDGVIRGSGQWWQHPDAIPQDAEVVEHLELQRIISRSLELLSSASENFDYLSVINTMESQLKTWSNQWEHHGRSSGSECCSLITTFYYHHANMVINLFGLRNALGCSRVDIPHFLSRCHSSAMACAAIVHDRLMPSGYMRYSPDSHFVTTSHVAVTLLKLIRPGYSDLWGDGSEVISRVQAIADVFERIATSPVHIPARCSTLLRALIKAKQETTDRLDATEQLELIASFDPPTVPTSQILQPCPASN